MRVTSQMIVNQAIANMNQSADRLTQLQNRAATGKQFQNASDDPLRAATSLTLRSTMSRNDGTLTALQTTGDWLDATDLALQQMEDLGTQAQTLAKQGLSDTEGVDERQALGEQIDSLLQEAVNTADSTQNGQYLFAGFQVNTSPYTYAVGGTVTNNVASTAGPIQHSLGSGQTLTVNIDGNATFSPLFTALANARDALEANDPNALQTALTSLATAADGVSTARSLNGARSQQVTQVVSQLNQTQTALQSVLSQNEDADMAQTLSLLSEQQTVYQASVQVGSRALSTTLFDFLK